MVKQKKCTRFKESGKNYAINCAIQGARLIWKQKDFIGPDQILLFSQS